MKELLTDEQLREAISLFASGHTRPEITTHFIETYPALGEHFQGADTDKQVRKALSDALRAADPASSRFSEKYKPHYETERQGIQRAITNKYEMLTTRSIAAMEKELTRLTEQFEELDYMLDTAIENHPVGTTEYLATLNARNAAQKRLFEISEKLLERLERIHFADKPL